MMRELVGGGRCRVQGMDQEEFLAALSTVVLFGFPDKLWSRRSPLHLIYLGGRPQEEAESCPESFATRRRLDKGGLGV